MRFEVLDGHDAPIGLDPGIGAVFLASIDDENPFTAESAIWFEREAGRQGGPIEIFQLFTGADLADQGGDGKFGAGENALTEELLAGDFHPATAVERTHKIKIAGVHPEQFAAVFPVFEHRLCSDVSEVRLVENIPKSSNGASQETEWIFSLLHVRKHGASEKVHSVSWLSADRD